MKRSEERERKRKKKKRKILAIPLFRQKKMTGHSKVAAKFNAA